MKCSEGEWRVFETPIKSVPEIRLFDKLGFMGDLIARCHLRMGSEGYSEALTNAHFIAAALELHEELKFADEIICNLCKRLNPQHEGCTSCEERETRLKAIAKAEKGD